MKNTNILDEYLSIVNEYKQKYKKSIVLLQVGSFYELYSTIENDSELTAICEILNIQMTKKNKSIKKISKVNPHMAGIPCISIEKYLDVLINNDYTVIVYNQYETKNKKIKRKLDKIYSISTYLDSERINQNDNLIMALYIEKLNNSIMVGISIINLSTGNIKLIETYNKEESKLIEDINKEIIIYSPKEIILCCKTPNNKYIDILNNKSNIFHNVDYISDYEKINFQNEFFNVIFRNILKDKILTPIEMLDLEKYNFSRLSLIYLLKFVYNYDNTIINNLNAPEIILNSNFLNLHNNALYQLNIISPNSNYKYNSLFDVINKTSTQLGKRFLNYNMTHPIIDKNDLNYRYQLIEKLQESNNYINFEKQLLNILDVEKYHKKLGINKLLPYNFGKLNNSYQAIEKLIKISKKYYTHFDYTLLEKFSKFYSEYHYYFNISNLESFNFNNSNTTVTNNIFNEFIILDLDELYVEINNNLNQLNSICNQLSSYINDDKIEIKFTDREGFYLSLTKTRASKLNKILIEKNIIGFDFINKTQSSTYITSNTIKDLSNKIIKSNIQIQLIMKDKYYEITNLLYIKYYDLLVYINYFISFVDLITSFTKVSLLNNYSKPNIIDSECSFVEYSGIRHPISELLHTDYNYVTNDISIGTNHTGYLLYGSNGVGKSTLMKAIGLNIILAQIGCFVSASKMNYSPYFNLFTRIDHSDNLFKGLSSFESEILELNTILNYSNSNSLVLGDEILNSTENISAISIISASINYFLENNISFIFASHLHQIPEFIDKHIFNKINISHLKMDYDPITKSFIYNRKLIAGMPIKNYGLIVAKSLLNNNSIINNAFAIQNKIINEDSNNILNTIKKSNYNSNLIVDACAICKDLNIHNNDLNILETHHIIYQQQFKDNKCLDTNNSHIKKNQTSNLVNLCKFHHLEVHKNNIKIRGWIKTSTGRKLDYN